MQYKFAVAFLAAAWMNTGFCAQHTSTSTASADIAQSNAKSKAKMKKHGRKVSKLARSRKGNTAPAGDSDADVLAQVLASDNRSPLWSGRPSQ